MDQAGQQLPPIGADLFTQTVDEALPDELDRRKIAQEAGGAAIERPVAAA